MPRDDAGDPWARAPSGELADPLLPRWFVVTALATIPAAIAAIIAAFVVFSQAEVGVAERRPPPSEAGLTAGTGEVATGHAEPVALTPDCPLVAGLRIAGADADRETLTKGLNALCDAGLDPRTADHVGRLADAGAVVRFAVFERTGVDSAAELDAQPKRLLLNARFSRTKPRWIAPLVALEATFLDADPTTAEGVLRARRAESRVCRSLFDDARPSRACKDARALLSMENPRAALRAAGYR